jgi:ribosomal protein L11 methyltransferase|tara:strand:- start:669 stop:1655 length:987 start_codon:yes stop_codon:yes gene_type:complete
MIWQKLMLLIESDVAARVESWLTEEGAIALTLEDGQEPPGHERPGHESRGHVAPGHSGPDPDSSLYEGEADAMTVWPQVRLTGLFDSQADLNAVIHRLESKCRRKLTCKLQLLPDQTWETTWQENFKPVRVSDKLWVCPSWCEPMPSAVNLLLDPGLAFGTGTHATTALCLEWLVERNLSGKSVIDFGCGSGILAIAALLLGSESAIAVDNDPRAIAAASENGRRNNCDGNRLKVCLPHQLAETEADIVLANIMAGPLIQLAARITSLTKPGGSVLLSGILTDQRDEVIRAYASGIEIEEVDTRDGWVCLHGRKQSGSEREQTGTLRT